MPKVNNSIKIVAVEKILQHCPGITLNNLAAKPGHPIPLKPKTREFLIAELFRHAGRVRMCSDRFDCSATTRWSLMRAAQDRDPGYQKMLMTALYRVPIRVYPADHPHKLEPLESRDRQTKCRIWVDPSLKTWARRSAQNVRPAIDDLPTAAIQRNQQ